MRGFIVMLLMVMMLALLAPMTAMAGGMEVSPILAMTVDKWSDVVTAKERAGPGDTLGALSKMITFMEYTTEVTMIDFGKTDANRIPTRARATADKAGGAAIFASGKPRAFADTFI